MKFDIKKVHPELMARCKEVLDKYTVTEVQTVSAGAGTFYVWVSEQYFTVQYVCVCVCVCLRACVRACVRATRKHTHASTHTCTQACIRFVWLILKVCVDDNF